MATGCYLLIWLRHSAVNGMLTATVMQKERGTSMKLAEALALRAETSRRIEQLRSRIVDNARYQEGDHFRPAGRRFARAGRRTRAAYPGAGHRNSAHQLGGRPAGRIKNRAGAGSYSGSEHKPETAGY